MCKKLFTVIKSLPMSASLLAAFLIFNFHRETQVHTLGVCVVNIGQQNLKIEALHAPASEVRGLFFHMNIFEHTLKNKI